MRWVRGLGALLILLAVVFGGPAALLAWGVPPDPQILSQPLGASLLLMALTLAGWLAWTAFVASLCLELVSLVWRRTPIPALRGLQQLSAGLVLAVLALAPTVPDTPPPAVGVEAAPDAAEAVPDEPEVSYLVQAGDDLWSISETLLGDGSRWRELAAANDLSDPTQRLAAGSRLRVPRITVQPGDTLSGLALEHLGKANRWPQLASANRQLIEDPDHIEVGWKLRIPGGSGKAHAKPVRSDDKDQTPADQEKNPRSKPDPTVPDSSPTVDPEPTPAARIQPDQSQLDPQPGTVVTTELSPPGQADASDSVPDPDPGFPLVGALGSLAAAAIIGALETRRALRLRERPPGRQLPRLEAGLLRLQSGLAQKQQPDRLAALDQTLRAVGRHCWESGRPLPELERATVGESSINLHWSAPAGRPPAGFTGTDRCWRASVADPPTCGEHPCPYPGLVSLGSASDGELLLVDAERSRVLGVAAADSELGRSSLAAMCVELACAPWAEDVRLIVVGSDAGLIALAGPDRVRIESSVADALAQFTRIQDGRRAALVEPVSRLRIDPDRAEAVAPVILCLLQDEVGPEMDQLLVGPASGMAVLGLTTSTAAARWQVTGNHFAPRGRLPGAETTLLAHAVPEPTRAGLARLFATVEDSSTDPAWWDPPAEADDNVRPLPKRALREDPVDIVRLIAPAQAPQLHLIGPAELTGAAGPEPARSRQQLIELCAWLLEHPGSSAAAMAAGLMVAESTRRSNLSRLRSWLGNDPQGSPYLPDAYSGRVLLNPAVTSDWERLQVLLAPGIQRISDETLATALQLIRGAPLADAAPGQWHWAEELRIEVSSVLRDVGLVLVERALSRGDLELARWAAGRALVVAPDDELLVAARIRTEYQASNLTEVERLVNQVTRQARILQVDLLPETVALCQQVMEGQLRARA